MDESASVYTTIQLDKHGTVVNVLDDKNRPVERIDTGDGTEHPARVGDTTPGGRIIRRVVCIEIVTEEDHNDPCYVHTPSCTRYKRC